MKVLIKQTEEVIDVLVCKNENGLVLYYCEEYQKLYRKDDLIFYNEKDNINWDEKLIEFSGIAMKGILSGEKGYIRTHNMGVASIRHLPDDSIVRMSISLAKELVKQLKTELDHDN